MAPVCDGLAAACRGADFGIDAAVGVGGALLGGVVPLDQGANRPCLGRVLFQSVDRDQPQRDRDASRRGDGG